MVTNNTNHFKPISGIKLEDWTSAWQREPKRQVFCKLQLANYKYPTTGIAVIPPAFYLTRSFWTITFPAFCLIRARYTPGVRCLTEIGVRSFKLDW